MAVRFVYILGFLLVCIVTGNTAVDLSRLTRCFVRQFEINVVKPPHRTASGEVLNCTDDVMVDSCWGRCDTHEIADYKIPYKLSNHIVCTYGGTRSRVVKLRCDERYPDPFYEVFDATSCVCDKCDPTSTSCESL